MPILKNAKKALRASKKKTLVNRNVKARMKTMMDHAKKEATLENLSKAFSAIDKAKKKNIIQKNKAAHLKAGLSALLGKIEAPKNVVKKSSKSKKA